MLIDKDSSAVHPEELIADISRSTLTGKLLLSIGIHVLLVLFTSIAFISLCVKYHTLDPQSAIQEEKALIEKQQETVQQNSAQEMPPAPEKSADTPDIARQAPIQTAGEKTGQSKIEQELKEVIRERPNHSTTVFDDIDELE